MINTAEVLIHEKKISSAEIVKVPGLPMDLYSNFLVPGNSDISVVENPLFERLPLYDAVLVASGTATLETGFYSVPMVIVYHVNLITYWLGKMLIKVPFIGLVNIVAEKKVAEELIQNEFTVQNAVKNLKRILKPEKNEQIRHDLDIIKQKLGDPGASARAAEIISLCINKHQ